MAPPSLPYRLVALCARALLPLASLAAPRVRRMRRERREGAARFRSWGTTVRRPSDPVVVLHAASAGELRQLEPVIRRLRAAHPDWQLVVTWFSTSGALVGDALGGDCAGALPWDSPWETAAFLEHLKPALLVVSKLDLWPELAWQAARRGIPVLLLAATVRPGSGRLRSPARAALRGAYALLSAVGAVAPEDADRLVHLGVHPQRITLTGDPRYDAVVERLQQEPIPVPVPMLVAGSTWPADDIVLLPAFAEVRQLHPAARLLLVPHQPDRATVPRISGLAMALDLPAPVPLAWETESDPFLVETRVGSLALLYGRGTMAYVGGGFGTAGLHSILEPAAAGVPVITGPRNLTPEAARLQAAGGLVVLDPEDAIAALVRQWNRWLDDEEERSRMGQVARQAVREGRGAAERSVALIEATIHECRPERSEGKPT